MGRILTIIVIVAGAWTAFIGIWGMAISGNMSTAELQDMQWWIGLGLISVGIGVAASGAARLLTAASDSPVENRRPARQNA